MSKSREMCMSEALEVAAKCEGKDDTAVSVAKPGVVVNCNCYWMQCDDGLQL